ncbi:MAG: sialidase family protein [Pseudomonadota bacterium]|nr:MAG: hypothetical protein DIU74_11015 [Pseudomonadota bacterium]
MKGIGIRIGAALFACALSMPGGAQQARHASKPRLDLNASATIDRHGVLWALYTEGRHLLLRRTADFGRTWSAPQPVNQRPEDIAADGDSRPKIAVAPNGDVYVSWTQPLSKPYTGHIRFARSTDGGKRFSEPITVNTDREEITHRFDSLTVNGKGQIFVAWVDKRDRVAAEKAGKDGYRGAAVYYAVSDDRGTSFRGDYKVADHSCECCRIGLLPQEDGSVLAMWRHIFAPNIRDHALTRLTADGEPGKVRRVTFDDWRVEACPHHGPSLAGVKDGPLHAVWFTQGDKRNGVYYGRLGDGVVEGLRQVGGDTAAHADVAAAGKRVAVAWKEFDGKRTQLRAMISEDEGRTWREHTLAETDGPSGQPSVLTHEDRFYVFWHTRQQPLSVHAVP